MFRTLSTKRPDMRFDCAMASGLRVDPFEIASKLFKNGVQKCPRNEALQKSKKTSTFDHFWFPKMVQNASSWHIFLNQKKDVFFWLKER